MGKKINNNYQNRTGHVQQNVEGPGGAGLTKKMSMDSFASFSEVLFYNSMTY